MRLLFLTTNDFGFGGSEDLWAETAIHMKTAGIEVGCSVFDWSPRPQLLERVVDSGCKVLWHNSPSTSRDRVEILQFDPDLVCVSLGFFLEGLEWIEWLASQKIPFVLVIHCVHENGWPGLNEDSISRYVLAHEKAERVYFVSEGNQKLYERTFGVPLKNKGIIRNPYKVSFNSNIEFPKSKSLTMATVGRLECFHKGFDLLMEALCDPVWKTRDFILNLYGSGPHLELLKRLATRTGLAEKKIKFHGQVNNIEQVWATNQVLIQPSRLEGLPLSVVEAMLCSRAVLATDVAGHSELVVDKENGILAEAATTRHVGKALNELWELKNDLEELGKNAREKIITIVPEEPLHEISELFEKLVADVQLRGFQKPIRRFGLANPGDEGNSKDHHAHVFYSKDGILSEEKKIIVNYSVARKTQLLFSGLEGVFRFDPSSRKGKIMIHSARLIEYSSEDLILHLASGVELESFFKIQGTAHKLGSDEYGFLIESTGDDPILMPDLSSFPNTTYNLEVILSAE